MTWKHTLIPLLLLTSTNAYAGDAPAAPPADDQASPELLELRGHMAEAGRDAALESTPRFRPLCDAEGYPLVGNLLPKTPDESMPGYVAPLLPPYQPSEFCAQVRADESKA